MNIKDVRFKGRTTIVTIDDGGIEGTGISKCMRQDHYSPEIGFELALVRASIDVIKQGLQRMSVVEKTWMDRAVTEEEYNERRNRKVS